MDGPWYDDNDHDDDDVICAIPTSQRTSAHDDDAISTRNRLCHETTVSASSYESHTHIPTLSMPTRSRSPPNVLHSSSLLHVHVHLHDVSTLLSELVLSSHNTVSVPQTVVSVQVLPG